MALTLGRPTLQNLMANQPKTDYSVGTKWTQGNDFMTGFHRDMSGASGTNIYGNPSIAQGGQGVAAAMNFMNTVKAASQRKGFPAHFLNAIYKDEGYDAALKELQDNPNVYGKFDRVWDTGSGIAMQNDSKSSWFSKLANNTIGKIGGALNSTVGAVAEKAVAPAMKKIGDESHGFLNEYMDDAIMAAGAALGGVGLASAAGAAGLGAAAGGGAGTTAAGGATAAGSAATGGGITSGLGSAIASGATTGAGAAAGSAGLGSTIGTALKGLGTVAGGLVSGGGSGGGTTGMGMNAQSGMGAYSNQINAAQSLQGAQGGNGMLSNLWNKGKEYVSNQFMPSEGNSWMDWAGKAVDMYGEVGNVMQSREASKQQEQLFNAAMASNRLGEYGANQLMSLDQNPNSWLQSPEVEAARERAMDIVKAQASAAGHRQGSNMLIDMMNKSRMIDYDALNNRRNFLASLGNPAMLQMASGISGQQQAAKRQYLGDIMQLGGEVFGSDTVFGKDNQNSSLMNMFASLAR